MLPVRSNATLRARRPQKFARIFAVEAGHSFITELSLGRVSAIFWSAQILGPDVLEPALPAVFAGGAGVRPFGG